MTNDWENQGLKRVADELKHDATFLSGWLPEQPDGREILRKRLELEESDWNRLLLCRPPTPTGFWDDVQQIAEYVNVEPVQLAQGLREVAVLGALRQVLGASRSVADEWKQLSDVHEYATGPLVAARDAAPETIALERSPRAKIQELTERFWEDAGQRNGHRDLQRAASIALPLAITLLPRLGLSTVSGWLTSFSIDYDSGQHDRPLRGLLIATRGLGMVFIDGSISEIDRRFTLAHEIGHFVVDYLEPRRRVIEEMPELTGVIDGERRPTNAERAKATLQRVPIGTYTYMIERDPHGGAIDSVEAHEDEATLFAMELLAPWDEAVEVVAEATRGIRGFDEAVGAATNALAVRFDLPHDVARARAQACLAETGRHRGLFDR